MSTTTTATITLGGLASRLQYMKQTMMTFPNVIMAAVHESDDRCTATTDVLPYLLRAAEPVSLTGSSEHREIIRTARALVKEYGITAAGNDALAQKFLAAVAKAGFYEEFAELTQKLLDRNPTDDELAALVNDCQHPFSNYKSKELRAVHEMVDAYCTKGAAKEKLLGILKPLEERAATPVMHDDADDDVPF